MRDLLILAPTEDYAAHLARNVYRVNPSRWKYVRGPMDVLGRHRFAVIIVGDLFELGHLNAREMVLRHHAADPGAVTLLGNSPTEDQLKPFREAR